MKCFVAGVALFFAPYLMAAPLLTCKTSGAPGSMVKHVNVETAKKGYIVMVESYQGGGFYPVKVLSTASTPVSTKLFLDAQLGGKTSLVIYEKHAAILYEASTASELSEVGANIEFLICK